MACTIPHNMIIKDNQDVNMEPIYQPNLTNLVRSPLSFANLVEGIGEVNDRSTHYALENDLIEYQCRLKGQA